VADHVGVGGRSLTQCFPGDSIGVMDHVVSPSEPGTWRPGVLSFLWSVCWLLSIRIV